MAAGCDDLVRKPFREQELFETLARHLRLRFIYDKRRGSKAWRTRRGLRLGPEQLEALPAELLRELRQAVIELDTARTQALIAQVIALDASLGRALDTLASQLDYKRLLKLLERGHAQTGQTSMNEDQQPTSAAARGESVAAETRVRPDSRVSTLGPGRIALGYAVVAILWIAFSDAVVERLKLPEAVMTIKGIIFVFVTASLLYFTIRRLVRPFS